MAKLFHYPPSYSPRERAADESSVAEALAWLITKIGAPHSIKSRSETAEFFELGVFGGDNAYWAARSPIIETVHLFDVTFEELGPGYLKVLVLGHPETAGREVHAVAFGIPASKPGAKEQAIELILGLSKQMGAPTPPNFRELLAEAIQPAVVTPAP